MKVEFLNIELDVVYKMLGLIGAKGRKARAVSKFRDKLLTKINMLGKDQKDILKELCELDESGELILNDNVPTFLVGKEVEAEKALVELNSEKSVLDLTEYEPFIEFLQTALEESDVVLSGVSAKAYDLLLDKLEALETKKGG